MEFLKNNARGIVIALLAVGVITAVSANSSEDDQTDTQPVVSQTDSTEDQSEGPLAPETDEDTDEEAVEEEATAFNEDGERENAPVEATDGTFSTTARSGDNQTTLMRDIISQYMDGKEIVLSAEQMLYVETNLVNNLPKDDLIFVGDSLSVAEADIEARVTSAGELTPEQLALWAQYL